MTKRPVFTFDKSGEEGLPNLSPANRARVESLRETNTRIPLGPLYKYLRPEHARAMVASGAIRVGTLGYYRRREEEDSLRGDSTEGFADYVESPPGLQTADNLSEFAKAIWTPPPGTIGLNNKWISRVEHHDTFVYCTSSELSARAAGDYTACVEITDVPRFINILNSAMGRAFPAQYAEVESRTSAVVYHDRELSHELFGYVSAAFVKEPKFEREAEVRIVWTVPLPGKTESIDFDRITFGSIVRLIEIPTLTTDQL